MEGLLYDLDEEAEQEDDVHFEMRNMMCGLPYMPGDLEIIEMENIYDFI